MLFIWSLVKCCSLFFWMVVVVSKFAIKPSTHYSCTGLYSNFKHYNNHSENTTCVYSSPVFMALNAGSEHRCLSTLHVFTAHDHLITDSYCDFAVVAVCTISLDSWHLLYTQCNVNSCSLYFGRNSSCGWCIIFVGDCLMFHLKSLPKQRGHLILWISLTLIQNVTLLHPLVWQFSFITQVL